MSTFVSPAEGRVTSEWGPRPRHPVTGKTGFHRGIDIAPRVEDRHKPDLPIRATQDGVVRYAGGATKPGPDGRWPRHAVTGTWNTGTAVVIDYDTGETGYYGHPSRIFVKPGQRVEAGDVIGHMGAVGNVTGRHLHYERWRGRTQGGGNGAGNTYNPREVFARHNIAPGSAPYAVKSHTIDLAQEDLDMPKLIKAPGRDETFVTNGLTKRWITSPYELGELIKLFGPVEEIGWDAIRRIPTAQDAVWTERTVRRGGREVPAIQELADIKTMLEQLTAAQG